MACNCFEEMIEKLKKEVPKHIQESNMGYQRLISLTKDDFVISFDDSPTAPFYLKFTAIWEKKSKKGNITEKKFPVRLKPSHCPLCGEEYNKLEKG